MPNLFNWPFLNSAGYSRTETHEWIVLWDKMTDLKIKNRYKGAEMGKMISLSKEHIPGAKIPRESLVQCEFIALNDPPPMHCGS